MPGLMCLDPLKQISDDIGFPREKIAVKDSMDQTVNLVLGASVIPVMIKEP